MQLSELVIDSVRSFVRTGSPQADLPLRWEQWPKSMVFDAGDTRRTSSRASSPVDRRSG